MFKNIIIFLLSLFIALVIAEVILRSSGYEPVLDYDTGFRFIPSNIYTADSILGFVLTPGSFKGTFSNGYSFNSTHGKHGRLCGPTYNTIQYNTTYNSYNSNLRLFLHIWTRSG